MNGTPLVRTKLRQKQLSFQKLRVDVSSSDSDKEGSESNDEAKSEDLVNFLCEFCDEKGSNRRGFLSRKGLIYHCLKCHPTACLGCYEMFASSEDLLQHLKAFPHEPPVCRACCRIFESIKSKSVHKCPTVSSPSKSPVPHKNATSCFVKSEPQDEVSDENGDTADDAHEMKDDTKMECSSEEETVIKEEANSKEELSHRFLCEFCYTDGSGNRRFQTKNVLISHCLKCHPNGCVGCFEMFASSKDLLQHLKIFPHEPPVCRECCRSFTSAKGRSNHRCPIASRLPKKDLTPRRKTRETLLCKRTAKVNVQIKHSESEDNDYQFSDSENDLDEKYVPVERDLSSEDDEEEEEDDDNTNSDNDCLPSKQATRSGKMVRDVAIHCMQCSFVAKGGESKPSLHLLRNHTCVAHPMVCLTCFEGFDDTESLCEHQKTMQHNIFSCIPCGLTFCSKTRYLLHLGRKHPDQCPFRCSECHFAAFKESAVKFHTLRVHKQENNCSKEIDKMGKVLKNACSICDYHSGTQFALMMHMYDKHPEPDQIPTFKCEECQVAFSQAFSYSIHIRRKHWDDPVFRAKNEELKVKSRTIFECEPCQRHSFAGRVSFIRHLYSVHRSSVPYECAVCSLGFLDPIDLRVHNHEEHLNSSPYVCDSCEHTFVHLDSLVNHLSRVHKLPTLPYAYCFKHNIQLYGRIKYDKHLYHVHLAEARGRQEFPCEQCGKVLTTRRGLRYHMKIHEATRSFACTVCDKRYATLLTLQNHKSIHTSKHQCSVCGKAFQSKPFLKRHEVVHTGEKPFECSICGLKVSQKSALQRHMAKVHPGGIMGNPRSTKSRKCRVLSKTLAKQKAEKSDDMEDTDESGEPSAAGPCTELKSMAELTSEEEKASDAPNVLLDPDLLNADLQTKPKPILPAKRQSRRIASLDGGRDIATLRPRKRRAKRPMRKDETWKDETWKQSSETSEEEDSSEDNRYEPPPRRRKLDC